MISNLSLSTENIHYVLNNSIKGQYLSMPDNVLGTRNLGLLQEECIIFSLTWDSSQFFLKKYELCVSLKTI